jgi:glycosyltransferase involved in cell wall biosynthesis
MASERPDFLISNSVYTQKRIKKYYRRKSQIIYPPIEMRSDQTNKNEKKCFITISRLSTYKKIDKIVKVFNELDLPLIIIGEGKERKKLEKIAGEKIKILGWQSDKKMDEYLSKAKAFIFPSLDDFGIAPVEAMARGVPVIAFKKGGALEYVEEGKTGEFFDYQEEESIKKAIEKFLIQEKKYDREYIINQAKKFSKERFKIEIKNFIEENITKIKSNGSSIIE